MPHRGDTMNADGPGAPKPDDEQYDIHLADGLSPEQADEAMRIFAAPLTRHPRRSGGPRLVRFTRLVVAATTHCITAPKPERVSRLASRSRPAAADSWTCAARSASSP